MQTEVKVVVPPGAVAGQTIRVQTPAGIVQTVVPPGIGAGMEFMLAYTPPAAPAAPTMASIEPRTLQQFTPGDRRTQHAGATKLSTPAMIRIIFRLGAGGPGVFGPVPNIGRLWRERRHRMPVARSVQGLATIHDSAWRARIAPARALTITSHAGIRIPASREDGDPHRAHLAQDPLIIGNEDSAGIHEHGGPRRLLLWRV